MEILVGRVSVLYSTLMICFFFFKSKKKKKQMGLEKYRILFEQTLKLKHKVESITEFLMYTRNLFFSDIFLKCIC